VITKAEALRLKDGVEEVGSVASKPPHPRANILNGDTSEQALRTGHPAALQRSEHPTEQANSSGAAMVQESLAGGAPL